MNRDPIQMTDINGDVNAIMESMSIDIDSGNIVNPYNHDHLYSEAVFAHGKESVEPILKCLTKCKERLESELDTHAKSIDAYNEWSKNNKGKKVSKKDAPILKLFNPKAFWRDQVWKDCEDAVQKAFGLRLCQIQPYQERYSSTLDEFESMELNAYVYLSNRYPITGVITDKGFHDNSNSMCIDMHISLGLLHVLEPEEVLAVFLHEMGHNIDPAAVSIMFTKTNALTKYITDRKGDLNAAERKEIEESKEGKKKSKIVEAFTEVVGIFLGLGAFIAAIISMIVSAFPSEKRKEKIRLKKLSQIREKLKSDKKNGEFKRQTYSEAFADNFARMYGYGPELARGLSKVDKDTDDYFKNRIADETYREEIITNIVMKTISDVHKTNMHRYYALIKEYDADLKDPNIPAAVKKGIKEDRDELEKVIIEYTKNFTEFRNRVNRLIIEELDEDHAIDLDKDDESSSNTDPKNSKESKDSKKK